MLRVLARLSAVLLSASLLGGCVTGLHETARTTPAGESEYGGIVTLACIPEGTPSSVKGYWRPIPEMYYRRGLTDNSDWGLRATLGPVLGIDYKHQLVSGGVDVAGQIGGSLYAVFLPFGLGDVGAYSLSPRILVSRESGLPWALNAGLDYLGPFGSGSGRAFLRAGVGLPFRVFKSVRIMPEVSYSLPLYSTHLPGAPAFGVSVGRVASEAVED